MNLRAALCCAAALAFGAPLVQGGTITFVAYKLGANAAGANAVSDVYNTWASSGGFNMGNASAASVLNAGLDYKDSFVDSDVNWGTVLSVDVGMYVRGVEVASVTFSRGNTKTDFYSSKFLTGTTYTDLSSGSFSGNYFGADGDPGNLRRWFIEQNYGGCPNDTGWFVVEDASAFHPCTWESSRVGAAGREFLYSLGNVRQNWTTGQVGSADVFAITLTAASSVPEPGTLGLLGAGVLVLGLGFRRYRRA